MNDKGKNFGRVTEKSNRKRHETQCSICNHAERKSIEALYCARIGQKFIMKLFGVSRVALWSHAREFNLDAKKSAKLTAEVVISNWDPAGKVDTWQMLKALELIAEIDAKTQALTAQAIIDHMSTEELKTFVETGQLPEELQRFKEQQEARIPKAARVM